MPPSCEGRQNYVHALFCHKCRREIKQNELTTQLEKAVGQKKPCFCASFLGWAGEWYVYFMWYPCHSCLFSCVSFILLHVHSFVLSMSLFIDHLFVTILSAMLIVSSMLRRRHSFFVCVVQGWERKTLSAWRSLVAAPLVKLLLCRSWTLDMSTPWRY